MKPFISFYINIFSMVENWYIMALSYVYPVQDSNRNKSGKYVIEYTRYTDGGLCIEVVSTKNIIWQHIKICFDLVCIKKSFHWKHW